VVRYPGKVPAGLRVERPVSTVGVFATVADLAGIAVPEGLHGGSLFAPDAEEDPVLAERFIWDESRTTDLDRLAINTRYRVYREGPLKLAVTSAGEAYLFDLAGEGEALDLAQSQPELLARAMSGLRRAEAKLGLPPIGAVLVEGAAPVLDDAARERLEALGYMD
jgi:arylsulfatase A-like enzyme